MDAGSSTVADLIRRNGTDPKTAGRVFLQFEDQTITHAAYYAESVRFARLFLTLRDPEAPLHVGVLMDNLPEYLLAFGGAALAGAVVVGINNTQRGASLARDVRHADCQMLLTEPAYLPLLEPIRDQLPLLDESRILLDQRREARASRPFFGRDLDAALGEISRRLGAGFDQDPGIPIDADARYLLVFTSGTTAAPKAVSISQRRMITTGEYIGGLMGVGADDCGYLAMPLFHANSQQCGFMPALLAGARLGMVRRFSKSRFLADVRRYGVTYFNYTGKPLSYILTTRREADDRDNPLRVCYGNEGSVRVIEEFRERFGCQVIDGFGATEGGFGFARSPGDPPGSVGKPPETIQVLRPDGTRCPAAVLDGAGRIRNPEEAIGEIVNTAGIGKFEGYYKNEEATRERTRGGMYWSGDFGYRDRRGYLYFTGRALDWIRVDGENFLAKPIEEALQAHPGVYLASVYGVPDAAAGDRVMATIVLGDEAELDRDGLYTFLASRPGFSPKWLPTYVRVGREVPMTPTNKVLVRELRRQKFRPDATADPVYWRERGETTYKPFTRADYERVRREFAAAGREHLLEL
ncbi:MAG: AMP-binding protein [Candidatus Binatia bacterium]